MWRSHFSLARNHKEVEFEEEYEDIETIILPSHSTPQMTNVEKAEEELGEEDAYNVEVQESFASVEETTCVEIPAVSMPGGEHLRRNQRSQKLPSKMHVLQKILFILLLQWVTLQSIHSRTLIALNRRRHPGGPNVRHFFATSPPRTEREESTEVHQITALPVDHIRWQKILVLRVIALDCSCDGEGGAQTTREGLNPVQILGGNREF